MILMTLTTTSFILLMAIVFLLIMVLLICYLEGAFTKCSHDWDTLKEYTKSYTHYSGAKEAGRELILTCKKCGKIKRMIIN